MRHFSLGWHHLDPQGTSVLKLAVSVLAPLAVAAVSGAATARSVRDWYPAFNKPFFTPPSWLFGPVWTVLYVMMGVALYLVWREGWDRPEVRVAMLAFGAQLTLNGLWSILFFGARSPGAALVEIVVLPVPSWRRWCSSGASRARPVDS
jgi:tryptophan-rich sensory protein